MTFDSLNLIPSLLSAVKSEGYEKPTPIQIQAIPLVLARKDVLGCAQTGTGKTAAFALPILQLLAEHKPATRDIRVLILTPTRELASQIAQSFTDYGKSLPFRNTVIFGGVGQNTQVKALRAGVDVLVATPGRLLDLMNQRLVHFRNLEIFVLDEADRMLDMGFIHDVRRIITGIPKQRQTLFFSATMPPEIRKLADQILNKPVRIEVTPVASTVDKIQQGIYHVDKKMKASLLIKLLEENQVQRGLVFTRTKRDANRVSETLNKAGIRSDAIHGNKSQGARERALDAIKSGQTRVLVATDIAARGIDIDQVTHVFNFDIPNEPESYVHRIGRTARAGTEGVAISFCAGDERAYLADIERLIRKRIAVLATPEGLAPEAKGSGGGGGSNHRGRPPGRGGQRPSRGGGGGGGGSSRGPRRGGSSQAPSRSASGGSSGGVVIVSSGHGFATSSAPKSPTGNPPASPNNRRRRRTGAGPKA